ncbi:hypothetical protein DIE14_33495 [Burkholderia sp. Bp9017]|nr:hypothetical protein DIE14_33495 [Burkholderia sp. Bp9017]RQZ26680.1 hypothetical protein DIE13_30205 [Burkholderia sp. Bp9016]
MRAGRQAACRASSRTGERARRAAVRGSSMKKVRAVTEACTVPPRMHSIAPHRLPIDAID